MSVVQPFSLSVFPAGTVFSHTVNSGVTTSADIETTGCANLSAYTKVTNANSGSIVVTLQGKDPVSGDYYTLLAGSSISSATIQRNKVTPTIAASANVAAQDVVPHIIRLSVACSTADVTGSVGIELTD